MAETVKPSQIDISALKKLSEFFQKEFSSLIDLYLQDSARLMERLQKFLLLSDLKNIESTARDLRKSSINVGAVKFSFMLLNLELAAQELRIKHPSMIWHNIERCYQTLNKELHLIKEEALKKAAQLARQNSENPIITS